MSAAMHKQRAKSHVKAAKAPAVSTTSESEDGSGSSGSKNLRGPFTT
jgi:hypothetical protein